MTGSTLSSAALDPRRRRILFRAWRRGTREMDLIVGRYADVHLPAMSEAGVDAFEALIDWPDTDLFDWITGQAEAPAEVNSDLLAGLRAFNQALKDEGDPE